MSQKIIQTLQQASSTHPDWAVLATKLGDPTIGLHLAIMREPFLSLMLAGTKTIETRFSKNRIAPYGQVASGDIVFLKFGAIVGCFVVSKSQSTLLTSERLQHLRSSHAEEIGTTDEQFWQAQATRGFVTLIGIADLQKLTPVAVPKHDMRGWVVLRLAQRRAG